MWMWMAVLESAGADVEDMLLTLSSGLRSRGIGFRTVLNFQLYGRSQLDGWMGRCCCLFCWEEFR